MTRPPQSPSHPARSGLRRLWLVLALTVTAALAITLVARHRGPDRPPPDLPAASPDAGPGATRLLATPPAPRCGDGALDPGEACDPPGAVADCESLVPHAVAGQATCTADCQLDLAGCLPAGAACGNGTLEPGELCDDGNRVSGDGCDADCVAELDGRAVHFDGPAVDARIERALSGSPCRDPAVRAEARRGPPRRLEYRLVLCELPSGETVFPLARVRASLAEVARLLRPARIELVEDAVERRSFDADCRVPWGGPGLRDLVEEAWAARTLPLFFVKGISGSQVPGMDAAGFAAFGYGAVLASTEPDVLAHELGHALGLLHTHACLAGGGDESDCSRTGDGLCDTPYDPGPRWLPFRCAGHPAESCPLECGDEACSAGASPDRANTMSYFDGCRDHYSPDQLDSMRCVLDHDLAWLQAADGCGSELCNGRDDDCDGQVDEDDVCASTCLPAEPLPLGRTTGRTAGHADAYGGPLYPQGTPDVLFELRPAARADYCVAIEAGGSDGAGALGPIVAVRDGCTWDAPIVASNLDAAARRLRPTLGVTAGPDAPAWLSVDGWGRSDGVAYRLDVRRGSCVATAAPLERPRLLEPASGARPTADPIQLRWEPVAGAEAYELRMSAGSTGLTDPDPCATCDAQIIDVPGVALQGVASGRRLSWTVRALRGDDVGPFATPRAFTVGRRAGERPLRAPRLRAPEPNALLPTLTETFSWEPVEDAPLYELRIGLDAASLTRDACEQCASFPVPGTEYQPTPRILGPGVDYLWTVRALREAEQGPFATPRHFAVDDWVCTRVGRLEVPAEETARTVPDGADDFEASCGGGSTAEQVWLVVPSETGRLCVDTEGSEVDTVLSVRRRCEAPETEIACNDEGFGQVAGPSRLALDAVAEQPLFVVVDGFDAEDAGMYWIAVHAGPCE